MQKHGTELADRPRYVAAGELMSGGMRTLLVGAGERIRRLRRCTRSRLIFPNRLTYIRALHSHLQPTIAVHYKAIQDRHAVSFLLDILNDPGHHLDHSRRSVSPVLPVAYLPIDTSHQLRGKRHSERHVWEDHAHQRD